MMKRMFGWLSLFFFCVYAMFPAPVYANNLKSLETDDSPEKITIFDATKKFTDREREHANFILAAMNSTSMEIRDEELTHELNTLVGGLAREAGIPDPDIEVRIFALPITFALSLPNKKILISSKMLNKIENRDQLAFLLAHEISHMYNHDMEKLIQKRINIEFGFLVLGTILAVGAGVGAAAAGPAISASAGGVASSSAQMTSQLVKLAMQAAYATTSLIRDETYHIVEQGFSDETEFRADKDALHILSASKQYNCSSAIDTILILKKDVEERFLVPQQSDHDVTIGTKEQIDQQTLIPAAEGRPVERGIDSNKKEKIKKAYEVKIKFLDERYSNLNNMLQEASNQ